MTAIEMQQIILLTRGAPEGSTVVEIGLILEPSLLERIEQRAEEQSMSVAGFIRHLLREFVYHSVPLHRASEVDLDGKTTSTLLD